MNKTNPESTSMAKIHRLLYRALIDIRHEGRELKSSAVFGLADLFHTIPLELERAANGDIDYDDAFKQLLDIAKERNYERWIENQLESIEKPSD